MVWIRGLLPILCASVLAIPKNDNLNRISFRNGVIMVNTSTSDLTEAEGNTYVPGPGYIQDIVLDKFPVNTFRQLPGLGNDIVVISESKQTVDGVKNIVSSRVETVTKDPIKSINNLAHSVEIYQGPRPKNFEGAHNDYHYD